MKIEFVFIAAFAVAVFSGCSRMPTQSDGQSALERKIQRESNGLIHLISFQKTDGLAQEVMGVKTYQLQYTAEIEFTDSCAWGDGSALVGWQGGFSADRSSGSSQMAMLMDMSVHYKKGAKGQREQVSSTLVFIKTENGWSLTGPNLRPLAPQAKYEPPSKTPRLGTVEPISDQSGLNPPADTVARIIKADLFRLENSANEFYILTRKWKAQYEDLVGPTKEIKKIDPVAGENYATLQFVQGEPIVIKSPDGRQFTSEIDARERARRRTEETEIHRKIAGNLNRLNMATSGFLLENPGREVVKFEELVGPGKAIAEIIPVAGENYSALVFKMGLPLVVRFPDGRPISGGLDGFFGSGPPDLPQNMSPEKQVRYIKNQLRQLSAAADQFFLESSKKSATFNDLVGPGKYVRWIHVIAGEDYTHLVFKEGGAEQVQTTDGRIISQ